MHAKKRKSVLSVSIIASLLFVVGLVFWASHGSALKVRLSGDGIESSSAITLAHALDSPDDPGRAVTFVPRGPDGDPLTDMTGHAELLAEFELTGDRRFLEKAQTLHPESSAVIFASALLADSPDSVWLERLEKLQPNNAFPNLARVAIHAKKKNLALFAEELRKGLSKEDFDTGLSERQALLLDSILETGRFPDSVIGGAERAFWERLDHAIKILAENDKHPFGDLETRASMALEFANKLRSFEEFSFIYGFMGHRAEAEILQKFQGDDWYGTDGMTVGNRLKELAVLDKSYLEKFNKYGPLIVSPDSDPKLKTQFFTRMRADGELAAVNWLMGQ